jgi:glycosyltransferase involved in cell wall biosynthesis
MDAKKIKVLFIIPTLNPGGIETYLLRFLKFIKKDDSLEPVVLVRSWEKGALFGEYGSLGLPIYFQPLGYFHPGRMLWYYRFFKKGKFDKVCDFNANFAGIPMFLARLVGIKNRITFYRQGKDHFKPSALKKIYNAWVKSLVYSFSTHILSNSKASLHHFFPAWEKDGRFKVIYNGINVNDFEMDEKSGSIRKELGIPEDAFVVCHSGRLDPAKNHPTILKVAKQSIDADKNIYFVFCGLYTEKLQNQVNALGIAGNIRLLGFRRDVPQILRSSNLFYFPSITEGQPNALIEAMLTGIPFVASNISPIKESIPENLSPILVNPFDVEESVKAIVAFQTNKNDEEVISIQKWAMNYFSSKLRFNEFRDCLI